MSHTVGTGETYRGTPWRSCAFCGGAFPAGYYAAERWFCDECAPRYGELTDAEIAAEKFAIECDARRHVTATYRREVASLDE